MVHLSGYSSSSKHNHWSGGPKSYNFVPLLYIINCQTFCHSFIWFWFSILFCSCLLKKCHQRQYIVRKLRSFGVNTVILLTFYHSFIESVLTFSVFSWFYSISLQDRTHLLGITKVCSEIIGHPVGALSAFCDQQKIRTAQRILHDPSHTLHSVFEWLPSGHRLHCPRCRAQKRRATFVPTAVQLLNSDSDKIWLL